MNDICAVRERDARDSKAERRTKSGTASEHRDWHTAARELTSPFAWFIEAAHGGVDEPRRAAREVDDQALGAARRQREHNLQHPCARTNSSALARSMQ